MVVVHVGAVKEKLSRGTSQQKQEGKKQTRYMYLPRRGLCTQNTGLQKKWGKGSGEKERKERRIQHIKALHHIVSASLFSRVHSCFLKWFDSL
jgi:hypothetical protein